MSDVTPLPDGPLKIAAARLLDADGNVTQEGDLFLCRCGATGDRPLCDGAHKAIGFRG